MYATLSSHLLRINCRIYVVSIAEWVRVLINIRYSVAIFVLSRRTEKQKKKKQL